MEDEDPHASSPRMKRTSGGGRGSPASAAAHGAARALERGAERYGPDGDPGGDGRFVRDSLRGRGGVGAEPKKQSCHISRHSSVQSRISSLAPALVPVDQVADRGPVQGLADPRVGSGEPVAGGVAQPGPEPGVQRDPEADLAPVDDLVGQQRRARPP